MVDLTHTTRTHLTVDEFAAVVHRTRRTVFYWIAKGKVRVDHTPFGRRIRCEEARRVLQYLDVDARDVHLPTVADRESVQDQCNPTSTPPA